MPRPAMMTSLVLECGFFLAAYRRSGKGSIIVLEVADEDAALRAARLIARETGRCVSVHYADMALI